MALEQKAREIADAFLKDLRLGGSYSFEIAFVGYSDPELDSLRKKFYGDSDEERGKFLCLREKELQSDENAPYWLINYEFLHPSGKKVGFFSINALTWKVASAGAQG